MYVSFPPLPFMGIIPFFRRSVEALPFYRWCTSLLLDILLRFAFPQSIYSLGLASDPGTER
jgi:hypothetical protein